MSGLGRSSSPTHWCATGWRRAPVGGKLPRARTRPEREPTQIRRRGRSRTAGHGRSGLGERESPRRWSGGGLPGDCQNRVAEAAGLRARPAGTNGKGAECCSRARPGRCLEPLEDGPRAGPAPIRPGQRPAVSGTRRPPHVAEGRTIVFTLTGHTGRSDKGGRGAPEYLLIVRYKGPASVLRPRPPNAEA